MRRILHGANPIVLSTSLAVIAVFVVWGVAGPESLNTVMTTALTWVTTNFGWVYVVVAVAALAFCVVLVFHPWGRLRLGADGEKPEFSTVSWVSMMFAAGLGSGLLFFGIAEPLTHYVTPPHGLAPPQSREAGHIALMWTYLHWGFNGWAVYAILGGALAYFSFRHDTPTLVSALFRPLLGRNVSDTALGRAIDVFAIVATLFGTATSLGLAGLSLNSGINLLAPSVPKSNVVAMILIAIVTVMFVVSATTGVEKGVQWLANIGAAATVVLMFFFLFTGGSTPIVISTAVETIGNYVIQVFPMSLRTGADGYEKWMANWTIFYWAWWVSWAPFVGTFVARISRGRTLREFVIGVVAAPTGLAFVWFAIVGGTGIQLQRQGRVDLVSSVGTPELLLFRALEVLPLPTLTSIVCLLLIALFFISGADAAAVVMGMMSCHGAIAPPKAVTIAFGVMMGAIAGALLLAGGLTALQQAAILGSVPFVFILLGLVWSWCKAMKAETDGGIANVPGVTPARSESVVVGPRRGSTVRPRPTPSSTSTN